MKASPLCAPLALSAAMVSAALALTACGGSSAAEAPAEDVTLTVFAAASLGEAFEQIGAGFEEAHPGVEVRLNVAGSSALAQQINAGAPVDVFASADESTMDRVLDHVEAPEIFASNTLTLVTPPDNPADVTSLTDATAEDVNLVVCAPQVPCGAASLSLAEQAGVELDPVSEESNVTDVLGKVTSGEADAGLVYATDATGAGDGVHPVEVEGAESVVNNYPIATLTSSERDSEQDALSREFVDHVLSEEGQGVLAEHGFGAP